VSNTNNNAGIAVSPTGSALVTGVLSKVTTNNTFNNLGIAVDGRSTTGASLNVTIIDSEDSNNFTGVTADSVSGHAATAVMLRNVVASYNGTGLDADGNNAILRVAHLVVTGNNFGLVNPRGGIINSYGDNDIDGNTDDNTGVLSPLAMH
jgi:hypothetical protein